MRTVPLCLAFLTWVLGRGRGMQLLLCTQQFTHPASFSVPSVDTYEAVTPFQAPVGTLHSQLTIALCDKCHRCAYLTMECNQVSLGKETMELLKRCQKEALGGRGPSDAVDPQTEAWLGFLQGSHENLNSLCSVASLGGKFHVNLQNLRSSQP